MAGKLMSPIFNGLFSSYWLILHNNFEKEVYVLDIGKLWGRASTLGVLNMSNVKYLTYLAHQTPKKSHLLDVLNLIAFAKYEQYRCILQ